MATKLNRQPRVRKRLGVRFGPSPEMTHGGFTLNVSARGLAIATQQPQAIRKHLFFELTNGADVFKAEGVVIWSQKGVIIAGVPSSMGVRLTWAEDRFFQFLGEITGLQTTPPPPVPEVPNRVAVQLPTVTEVPVSVNGTGETTELLPDFMTMLLDAAHEAPTPVEVRPPRDRVERAPRYSERLAVSYGAGVLISREGTTLNLSDTGLAVATTELLDPGEMVVFTVRGRDGSVGRGAGVVAWVSEGDEDVQQAMAIGIRLTLADDRYRRLLGRLSLGL